jgi:hypothetical protein
MKDVMMHIQHLSIDELKTQAKALRQSMAQDGHVMSHSKSLEILAKQLGYRNWNTLSALAGNHKAFAYAFGQPFEGEVIGLRKVPNKHRFGVTIKFDVPVDVVKFEGMSNFRSRINIVVNENGISDDKTSDGQPHLKLAA